MCPDNDETEREDGGEVADQGAERPKFTDVQIAFAEAQIVEQSKRIEFYITEFSVELLAKKMENGDFVVPPYQRNFTWEPDRRSRFVESLLMGLPIPFLFFWENPETGSLEVVDGSQRLRTIQQFVSGDLRLGKLDNLGAVSNFTFNDLPESRQRKIKNRSIRGLVLNEHADEAARFDIFDRINTGSKVANTAEVRRGALRGPFLDMVIDLAEDELFKRLAPVPAADRELREAEELVTRFFAYTDGLEGYHDRVWPFIYAYSKRKNAEFTADPALEGSYRDRFRTVMEFVDRHFPYGFRRNAKGKATPRARFEAIAVGTYLALEADPALGVDDAEIATWVASSEFQSVAGSGSANAINKLRGRMNYVRDKLSGA